MGFVFTQLGGPQKRLELADYDAPFGRPRQKAVVTDGIEVRESTTYYPGNDDEPTVHIFGHKHDDWELDGRFRDRSPTGGQGHATAKTEEVKQFVADKQRVRITWEDLVSVVGLIKKFQPGRESAGEVAWKMTIKVLSNDFADKTPREPHGPDLPDYLSKILAYLAKVPDPRIVPGLGGSPLDALDSLVSGVTGAVGGLTNMANDVSNFEKSTIGELNRVGNVTTQLSTAASTMRDTFSSFGPDASLVFQRADENMSLFATQTSVEDQVRGALATASDLQRAIAIAKAGKLRTTYVVKGGDTWEQIAVRLYGQPGRAVDLQVANGQIGKRPKVGTTIQVPR